MERLPASATRGLSRAAFFRRKLEIIEEMNAFAVSRQKAPHTASQPPCRSSPRKIDLDDIQHLRWIQEEQEK